MKKIIRIRWLTSIHPNRLSDVLAKTVQKYERSSSRLADWLEGNLPEGLTGLAFPEAHRMFNRTTNGLERVSQEILCRTRVVRIFSNEASCLS